jgi:hypothetical protein
MKVRLLHLALPHESRAGVIGSDHEAIAALVWLGDEVGDHAEAKALNGARFDNREAVVDRRALGASNEWWLTGCGAGRRGIEAQRSRRGVGVHALAPKDHAPECPTRAARARTDRQLWARFRNGGLLDRPDEDEVAATKQRLSTDFCQKDIDVEVSLVDRAG